MLHWIMVQGREVFHDLFNELFDYFHSKTCNKDVVDLLIALIPETLGVTLCIYEEPNGKYFYVNIFVPLVPLLFIIILLNYLEYPV